MLKEYEPKIKVFGVGGCGNNIVHNIKGNARLSKILLNTDIAHLNIASSDSNSLDAAILCGRNLCRGLGCGGEISKGYESAKESFSNIMYVFNHNQINLFVCGLGGGAGTGITKYILEDIKKNHKNYKDYNECNFLLCTYPLSIEKKRVEKARNALKAISKYCDMVILIEMDSFKGRMSIQKLFQHVNSLVRQYILNLSKLSNKKIIKAVKKHKGKLLRIKSESDFQGLI